MTKEDSADSVDVVKYTVSANLLHFLLKLIIYNLYNNQISECLPGFKIGFYFQNNYEGITFTEG